MFGEWAGFPEIALDSSTAGYVNHPPGREPPTSQHASGAGGRVTISPSPP